ncbi:MAG: ATP-dependent helicase HrpB [Verrucomicrobiota bacterium]
MNHLPVNDRSRDISEGLREKKRLVLQAPTGSGKSSQVPQILHQAGFAKNGQIIILQPRRLPARMLARRVAQEMGVRLGSEVGYKVRFDNKSSVATQVVFLTEALLLRKMLEDPDLQGVSVLIFDEFHERNLHSDLCLARAKHLQETTRPDLHVMVMSATLNTKEVESYLGICAVVKTATRLHPVDIYYAKKGVNLKEGVWEVAANQAQRCLSEGHEGDVLIFMPGVFEIHKTIQALKAKRVNEKISIYPLYGELSVDQQDEALAPSRNRKIIVATNVAETSLTIEGVRIVIDSGLARVARYDAGRGINALIVEKISRASADQRAGRAGRVAPGVCYRLWSEFEHEARISRETAEVHRVDLSEAFLALKGLGYGNVKALPWFEMPEARLSDHALNLLKDLGAVEDDEGQLTKDGEKMLHFPLHPRYSKMLLMADRYGCVREACLVCALTQGRDILLRKVSRQIQERREDVCRGRKDSDLLTQIILWKHVAEANFSRDVCDALGIHSLASREVAKSFSQIDDLAYQQGLDVSVDGDEQDEPLLKCIFVAFADQVARRKDGGTLRCEMVHGRSGEISQESVVRDCQLLVATRMREVERGKQQGLKVFLENISRVEPEWLKEIFPEDFCEKQEVIFDASMRRVMLQASTMFRDLTLHCKLTDAEPGEKTSRLLAQKVAQGELILKKWTEDVEQWIMRLNLLADWCPDLSLPQIDTESRQAIFEMLCEGAVSYKDIKEKDVWPVIKSWLSAPQEEALHAYAPSYIKIHEHRKAKVRYSMQRDPVIAVKIQDLYDAPSAYTVAMGRVKVLVEILAPNMRPVQITDDLENFWKESYPEIKKELKRRYPKHEWR